MNTISENDAGAIYIFREKSVYITMYMKTNILLKFKPTSTVTKNKMMVSTLTDGCNNKPEILAPMSIAEWKEYIKAGGTFGLPKEISYRIPKYYFNKKTPDEFAEIAKSLGLSPKKYSKKWFESGNKCIANMIKML